MFFLTLHSSGPPTATAELTRWTITGPSETFRMNSLKTLILCCTFLTSACSSLGQLDASTSGPAEDESIFVIGVAPENYRIFVFPGSVKDGRFSQSLIRPATVYGSARQGFVVGKAQAGDVLAITQIRAVSDSSSILGADFKPCGDAKTMVFEAPKSKLLYLGSIEYKFEGNYLIAQYRDEIERAQRHIESNFPHLKGKLEPLEYKLLPSSGACEGTIYIPIFR